MFESLDRFDLVIACDGEGGIGKKNNLPWRLPGDVKHFRTLTSTVSELQPAGIFNAVIMGRKTWESLPQRFQPLPNRINVVLTRDRSYRVPAGALAAASLDEALEKLTSMPCHRVFVIGGAAVLADAMKHERCGLLYLTEIAQVFDCDVFLPSIHERFHLVSAGESRLENGIEYAINVYAPSKKPLEETS